MPHMSKAAFGHEANMRMPMKPCLQWKRPGHVRQATPILSPRSPRAQRTSLPDHHLYSPPVGQALMAAPCYAILCATVHYHARRQRPRVVSCSLGKVGNEKLKKMKIHSRSLTLKGRSPTSVRNLALRHDPVKKNLLDWCTSHNRQC